MKQDISILLADLSGYTALTESNGSLTAADLIDRYIDTVTASLIGDSHLQEPKATRTLINSPNYCRFGKKYHNCHK